MATVQNLTYQELKAQLDDVMVWFESEDVDLDKALMKYEEGMKIVEQLEKQLTEAENKVTKLKQKFSE